MAKSKAVSKNLVIVLLSVILVAVVGYLVYGNLSEDSQPVVEQSTKPDSANKEITFKEVCAPHEKMCLNYPADWTVKVGESEYPSREAGMTPDMSEEDFSKIDIVTLTSKDSSAQVTLHSGITGIGGVCFPEDHGKTYILRQQKTRLTDFMSDPAQNPDAYAVSLVTSNPEGTEFTPKIGLTRSSSLIDQQEADGCAGDFFSIIDGRNIQLAPNAGGGHGSVLVGTKSIFNDDNTATKTYSTLDEAKKYLETEAYKQAFDIIASAHYK